MGNVPPVACLDRSAGPKTQYLNKYLTPQQIQMVQTTWDIMKEDLPTLGVAVFLRLFETEPDMKRLFPKIVRLNEVSQLEMDVDRDMLQKHAVTVMEGLGAAVESLEDSDFLNSVLVAIGQTHVKRNVKPHMLKRLWPSLNYGFSQALGARYDTATAEAWRRVYHYISLQMKRGMENPDIEPCEDATAF